MDTGPLVDSKVTDEVEIPAEYKEQAEEYREKLIEACAEAGGVE